MDYSDQSVIITGVLISNIVALIMLWLSWKKPGISRLLFFMLFIWAGITNWTTAANSPEKYLEYADFAILPFYKHFILGFFSENVTVIVPVIAFCQLLIGVSMLLKGLLFKIGCIGGMIFLISILPLGWGSGSPSPLLWAIGLLLLFNKNVTTYWWQTLMKRKYSQ